MPRGIYGAIDRERHWVAAWAEDQAVEQAIDAAVPTVVAVQNVRRGIYGARRLVVGAQMLESRGESGRSLGRAGNDWFHSVADRKLAIEHLTAAFRAFMFDLADWHAASRDLRRAMATAQWVEVDVLPTMREWNAFSAREKSSWWVRAATSWKTFTGWFDRLRKLRELARAHGIALTSPEPEPLPQTLWEQGENGHGSPVAPWFGIAKVAIGGAMAIAGGLTVYSMLTGFAKRPPEHIED